MNKNELPCPRCSGVATIRREVKERSTRIDCITCNFWCWLKDYESRCKEFRINNKRNKD